MIASPFAPAGSHRLTRRRIRRWTFVLLWGLLSSLVLSSFAPAPPRPNPTNGAVPPAAMALPPELPDLPDVSTAPEAPADTGPSLTSAYVQDMAVDGNQRLSLVRSSPINYRADDGSWQPIDPRFEARAGGFVNERNVLQVRAKERRAALWLRHDRSLVGWESEALVLQAGDQTTTLAHPLLDRAAPGTLADHGQTIRYAHTWSLPGLIEEVRNGAGQVEQQLVLAERPAAADAPGKTLALYATLYLDPGQTLTADGTHQNDAFATPGAVQVRDAQGQVVLEFAPPLAFEQANPATRTPGRYRLTRLDAEQNIWRMAVETPWAWWADPARTYPVVLDPTMHILRAIETASVIEKSPCAWEIFPSDDPSPAVQVGAHPDCGKFRALVRFNSEYLPTLPPGASIETVRFLAVPTRGFYHFIPNPYAPGGQIVWPASAMVEVRPVLEAWSPGGGILWNDRPTVSSAPIDEAESLIAAPSEELGFGLTTDLNIGPFWTLQTGDDPNGAFSQWRAGENYGLELRSVDEATCDPADTTTCGFVEIPTAKIWTDDEEETVRYWEDMGAFWTEGGGFMLLIRYTPPTLHSGVPHTYGDDPPRPPIGGDDYRNTHHTYTLPESDRWVAVGVKSLNEAMADVNPDPNITDERMVLNPGGDLHLCNDSPHCSSRASGQNPNYLVYPDTTGGVDVTVEAPDAPADTPDRYVIEAVEAEPWVLPATDYYTGTLEGELWTKHGLHAYDLNLQPETNVAVFFDYRSHGDNSHLEARLFQRQPSRRVLTPSDGSAAGEGGYSGDIGEIIELGPDDGGSWGLVVSYGGSVHPIDPESMLYGSTPVTITYRLKIVACPANAIPTAQGTCAFTWKPARSFQASDRADAGPYRIYGAGGFQAPLLDGSICTNSMVGDKEYVVYLGTSASPTWESPDENDHLVMVSGSEVCFRTTPDTGQPYVEPAFLAAPSVFLAVDPPADWNWVQLWNGGFAGGADGNLVPQYATYTGLPLRDGADADSAELVINVPSRRGEGTATLERTVEGASGPLTFNLAWTMQAVQDEKDPPPASWEVTKLSGPDRIPDLASLELRFGENWHLDFNGQTGQFTTLETSGNIVQPEPLGSAWKPIVVKIFPDDVGRPTADGIVDPYTPTETELCGGYHCLDLRNPTNVNNRTWEMPDIEIAELPAGSAALQGDEVSSIPFSFRTFGGEVQVGKEPCPQGSRPDSVTVIRGTTHLALPGMGSDYDPSQMIEADFVLCESKLRRAALSFHSEPGIPIPPTPIFLDGLGGTITIGDESVSVSLLVDYYLGDKNLIDSTDGATRLTVDTAGMFSMTTAGTVLKVAGYEGWALVAWDPLDVDIGVEAFFPKGNWWVKGDIRAHAWKGQGWQHRYSHLPDNDATHFTARGGVRVRIPKGEFFSEWWCPDIPPTTIHLGGVSGEVGEFCTNGSCTSYEWGVEGIFRYSVGPLGSISIGAYMSMPPNDVSFILFSDGKTLIDQAGTAMTAEAAAQGVRPVAEDLALAPGDTYRVVGTQATEVTQPLTVTERTASFLAVLSWAHGDPQLTLTTPDGEEITPQNAADFGVQATTVHSTTEADALYYAVTDPMPGEWTARIINLTGDEDFHFSYFANRTIPPVTDLTPATDLTVTSDGTPGGAIVPVRWTPPSGAEDLRVSLYYSATVPTTTTLQTGVVVENVLASEGGYDWDMSYLAAGTYQLYAQVGDGAKPSSPLLAAPQRMPGSVQVVALGRITLVDDTPPATPEGIFELAYEDALLVCWRVPADHDLSGYVLRYTRTDVDGNPLARQWRVQATVAYSPTTTRVQCARLVGLNPGPGVVIPFQVAAYDASGNLSGYSPPQDLEFFEPGASLPDPPTNLVGRVVGSGEAKLEWTGIVDPFHLSFYHIHYYGPAPDWNQPARRGLRPSA
ncbi:MAG: hypothetical protein HC884_05805 [Chloroflexaceae bacterium]|nr:hypothetical protein [Chloroflexaceae bacterium]